MIFFLDPYTVHNTDSTIFEAVFDTTKTSAGSSDANTITLPLTNMDGLVVDWGDGTINSSNTHTYSSPGVKTVKIEGLINAWRFNNSGDRLKITEIKSWGSFYISLPNTFYGCGNLKLDNVNGTPIITSPLLVNVFRNCSSLVLVKNINLWDVSNVTNMQSMFNNSTAFNQNISSWDVSNVTDMSYMFQDASSFNQNIGGWDVSNVTNMWSMFQRASSFNQNIGGWDVSNVTNMQSILNNATAFNQDISNWDIRNVTSFTGFMQGKNSTNYNASYLTNIYDKWSLLTPLNNGITISFGSVRYTSAGQAGRDILTTTYGWTITDGGI